MRALLMVMVVGAMGCESGPAPVVDGGAHDAGAPDAGSRCADGGGSVSGGGSQLSGADMILVEYDQSCFECPFGYGLSDGGTLRVGDGTVGAVCTINRNTSVAPCKVFCCACPAAATKHFWSQACVNGTCPDEARSCAAALDFAAGIGRPLCQ